MPTPLETKMNSSCICFLIKLHKCHVILLLFRSILRRRRRLRSLLSVQGAAVDAGRLASTVAVASARARFEMADG